MLNSLPVDSFGKYEVITNLEMCILMYFKIQSDQARITQSAFKKSTLIYLWNCQDINKISVTFQDINKILYHLCPDDDLVYK